jgi:integrase
MMSCLARMGNTAHLLPTRNWVVQTGLLTGTFPNNGIRFLKGEDKRPFMTWADIERRIGRGGLDPREAKKWWDCLFLDLNQVAQFVGFMKSHCSMPWMYPMVAAAAYTGARRSELLRIHVDDIDLQRKTILIHERKRVKGQKTTRRVPPHPVSGRRVEGMDYKRTPRRTKPVKRCRCRTTGAPPWTTQVVSSCFPSAARNGRCFAAGTSCDNLSPRTSRLRSRSRS